MNVQTATLGGLTCQVLDALPDGAEPELVVVFCHGFGAPGTDLVSLGPEILSLREPLPSRLRFVFPAAPLAPAEMRMFGGRAWWPLDVEQITRAIEQGELRDMRQEIPEGMSVARDLLVALVDDVNRRNQRPTNALEAPAQRSRPRSHQFFRKATDRRNNGQLTHPVSRDCDGSQRQ